MSYFLESIILKIGCYSHYLVVVAFLLFIILFPHYGYQAANLFVYFLIFIFIGILYYIFYSKDRLDNHIKMLEKKARETLKVSDDVEMLTLTKKHSICNSLLMKQTRKDYDVAFIFLSDDYLTIALKCPMFHMFYKERHGKEKRWGVKNNCASSKELRYSYIQSVHFDVDKKEIKIVLTSGLEEPIACDKPIADKAIIQIRKRLRETQRTYQTNVWSK